MARFEREKTREERDLQETTGTTEERGIPKKTQTTTIQKRETATW